MFLFRPSYPGTQTTRQHVCFQFECPRREGLFRIDPCAHISHVVPLRRPTFVKVSGSKAKIAKIAQTASSVAEYAVHAAAKRQPLMYTDCERTIWVRASTISRRERSAPRQPSQLDEGFPVGTLAGVVLRHFSFECTESSARWGRHLKYLAEQPNGPSGFSAIAKRYVNTNFKCRSICRCFEK